MVNQQFTFAVHIMTALAFDGGIVASNTLARSVSTNSVVVRRLLLALREAGLIETFAGKHGGAQLARPAKRITLLEIYRAVQPRPVIHLNERTAARHCTVSCNMQRIMRGVVESAEEALRQKLRTISLQTLVQQVN